jgi:hypothetical protein
MNKALLTILAIAMNMALQAQDKSTGEYSSFTPGSVWKDNTDTHINAHGGGVLYHEGKYFWFGEYKSERSSAAFVGVTCYSSDDLYNWKYESVALPVVKDNPRHDIASGCVLERPKVIYNEKTKQFVMYFHLELKGKGYNAARVGIAVSDKATGPYTYLKSYRPNAGHWPTNLCRDGARPVVFGRKKLTFFKY